MITRPCKNNDNGNSGGLPFGRAMLLQGNKMKFLTTLLAGFLLCVQIANAQADEGEDQIFNNDIWNNIETIEKKLKENPKQINEIQKIVTEYETYKNTGEAECYKKIPKKQTLSAGKLIGIGDCFAKYNLFKSKKYWTQAVNAKNEHSVKAITRINEVYQIIGENYLSFKEAKKYFNFLKTKNLYLGTLYLSGAYFIHYGDGADKNNLDFWKAYMELSKLPVSSVTALPMISYIVNKGLYIKTEDTKNELKKLCKIYDRYVPELDKKNTTAMYFYGTAIAVGICEKRNMKLGDYYTFNAAFLGQANALSFVDFWIAHPFDRRKRDLFYKNCFNLNKLCYGKVAESYLNNFYQIFNLPKALKIYSQGAKAGDEVSMMIMSEIILILKGE